MVAFPMFFAFIQKQMTRTYLKKNLSAHGCVAKRFKLLIPLSAGLRFLTVSRLALNPNLIFEIGSNYN
jgi:hypothetical protein